MGLVCRRYETVKNTDSQQEVFGLHIKGLCCYWISTMWSSNLYKRIKYSETALSNVMLFTQASLICYISFYYLRCFHKRNVECRS